MRDFQRASCVISIKHEWIQIHIKKSLSASINFTNYLKIFACTHLAFLILAHQDQYDKTETVIQWHIHNALTHEQTHITPTHTYTHSIIMYICVYFTYSRYVKSLSISHAIQNSSLTNKRAWTVNNLKAPLPLCFMLKSNWIFFTFVFVGLVLTQHLNFIALLWHRSIAFASIGTYWRWRKSGALYRYDERQRMEIRRKNCHVRNYP